MTKSADFGQFREDAYIRRSTTAIRFIKYLDEKKNTYHKCSEKVRLDHTRAIVRRDYQKLAVLNPQFLKKDWKCKCEEEQLKSVETAPLTMPVVTHVRTPVAIAAPVSVDIHTVRINGIQVEGSIESIKSLLGV